MVAAVEQEPLQEPVAWADLVLALQVQVQVQVQVLAARQPKQQQGAG